MKTLLDALVDHIILINKFVIQLNDVAKMKAQPSTYQKEILGILKLNLNASFLQFQHHMFGEQKI